MNKDITHPDFLAATETLQDIAIDALEECEEYFDGRADAELFTDSPTPHPNQEMKLLMTVRAALYALRGPS